MQSVLSSMFLTMGILFYASVSAQSPIISEKISDDKKKEISENLAINMVDKYRRKRYNRVRKFPVVGIRYDSKSFWYSIQELKKLIQKAESLDTDTHKTDGIRMYFGVYPKKTVYRTPENSVRPYSNLHTLLFVPTTAMTCKGSDCHLDRTYPNGASTGNQKVVLLNLDVKDDGSVVVDNHGELCPPPNPCSGTLLIERADLKKKIKSLNIN